MHRLLIAVALLPAAAPAQEPKGRLTATGLSGELKAGEERDFVVAAGVKMRFCWIPAGEAKLGSPAGEDKREVNEIRHTLETPGFWLGKYEVSQAEWEALTGKAPSRFPGAGLPAESVSWDDAQALVKKCKVTGLKVRLPTEDEWEYACRGGTGNEKPFYWGAEANGDQDNVDGSFPYGTTIRGQNVGQTMDVGAYAKTAPHPWGLCDMHGNVREWCENLFVRAGTDRAARGGSWHLPARYSRAAYRTRLEQTATANDLGVRLALIP